MELPAHCFVLRRGVSLYRGTGVTWILFEGVARTAQ